jgi:hypothetical protein
MRGGNTSVYGSMLSFVILFPVAIFIGLLWLWGFTKGFFGAAFHCLSGAEGEYAPKD